VAHIIGVVKLMAFIKPSNGIWPIAMGEMFY